MINRYGFPPFNPFSPFPFFPPVRRRPYTLIDTRGVPVISTTGKLETAATTTIDYGINPCQWKALPNQCVILWKVQHPSTTTAASYGVNVIIPSGTPGSTLPSPDTPAGTTRKVVIDNKSNPVVGSDVNNPDIPTEHWVYIDKCAGIFKLLGVQTATPVASE